MEFLLPATGSSQISTYERLFEEYIDNRILVFNDEVDDNVIENYIMYILKWNMDDRDLPADKRKKIVMLISSPGGNSFSANIMIDVIIQSITPIVGIGLDLVASAAYLIYLACHERYSYGSTAFLQHEGDMTIENSRSKFKNTATFFEEMDTRTKNFILSRTNMTEEFYDKMYEQEFWFFAQKGKELGVVHKIIGEDCTIYEALN